MIKVRLAEDRGHADHGWLKAAHTFSFARYYEPTEMGFSDLIVINDDRIAPHRGFGAHPHDNMEILTYVLEGELTHQDSMGNSETIKAGEIQLMSAGSGVVHSEKNGSDDPVHLLQIWLLPNEANTPPRYQQLELLDNQKQNQLTLIVSPNGEDQSLQIRQETRIYAGGLTATGSLDIPLKEDHFYYFHLAKGRLSLNGHRFKAGDGARIYDETQLTLSATGLSTTDLSAIETDALHSDKAVVAEFLLFELRPYHEPRRG
ncbi:pirin family protein [Ignatzschineria larvae DSM 13226]|uniref:Pirin family protein n=1 Tax=Ignatzschineria larvae DSM 13226 TaxID=1111732 RepID=A0ABZ3BWH8_9GAMM|nr:pirin family protein [Ignatzschineria larvae]